jgi:branched-chain amino acid transport system substrate-binding protein
MNIRAILLVALALIAVEASCIQAPLVVKMGVVANFEGQNPKVSLDCFKSIKLAYRDYSKQHPDSVQLELKPIDDSWDPEKIRSAYATIIGECDIIFFDTTSTAFLSVYPEVLKHPDKLHVIVGPTTTSISHRDDNVIRNGIDVELEQAGIASFLNSHGLKKLFVARENRKNSKYTEQALGYLRQNFQGQVTVAEFSALDINLTECLKTMHGATFDSVYILAGSTPQAAGILIQNVRKEYPTIEIITTPWVRGQELIETAGPAIKNVIVSSHVILSGGNEKYNLYEKAFMNEFGGSRPSCYAPLTYDAALILLDAIRRTRSTTSTILKRYILENSFNGTSGTIRFDTTGDTTGRLFFFRIDDGVYAPIE